MLLIVLLLSDCANVARQKLGALDIERLSYAGYAYSTVYWM